MYQWQTLLAFVTWLFTALKYEHFWLSFYRQGSREQTPGSHSSSRPGLALRTGTVTVIEVLHQA